MAKAEMICPFSSKLCKECPLYRGRHHYLCFCKKYRGHVEKSGEVSKASAPIGSGVNPAKQFEVPSIIPTSAIDPFSMPLKDINE